MTMPESQPEPEKYSIDDMMDRLKGRSDEAAPQGELVTRADGTQAIRVRKRKRRTRQSHKETERTERRLRAIQITVVLVLLFILVLGGGGLAAYYNSPIFQSRILSAIGASSGAKVSVTQFRVTPPIGANASTAEMKWPGDGILKEIAMSGVQADLRFTSFLGQPWSGEELTAASASIRIGVPSGTRSGGEAPGFSDGRFKIARFRSSDSLLIVGETASPVIAVKGAEISLTPKNQAGDSELRLNRGTLKFAGSLPEFKLDRSWILFDDADVGSVNLHLLQPSDPKANLAISGDLQPFTAGGVQTLQLTADSYPLQHLTGPDFATFINGRVETQTDGAGTLSFDPASTASVRLTLPFRGGVSSAFSLTGLPFLRDLSRALDDDWYDSQKPEIDTSATGTLVIEGSEVRIENLRFEAKNRILLTGTLSIRGDQTISGKLKIGLLPQLISASNARGFQNPFREAVEGLRWAEVTLSGTTTAPKDDFRGQMDGPSRDSAAPQGRGATTPSSKAASEFEEMTQPR